MITLDNLEKRQHTYAQIAPHLEALMLWKPLCHLANTTRSIYRLFIMGAKFVRHASPYAKVAPLRHFAIIIL